VGDSERPNVLVIMSDQHSRHFLGCYGNGIVRTPNLDRLAAEGMRFDNCYCPSPLCVPSRMSFMTSRTPTHNEVWDNGHILSSAIPTWAHHLGAAGYETALVGRMHFVGPDQRHGFERRPIGEYSARHPGSPEKGGPRWQRFPSASSGQHRAAIEIAGHGDTTYQEFDRMVTAAALGYLDEKAADTGGRAFAAVTGFVLPHCPFICPKDLFDYYLERDELPVVEESRPPVVERLLRARDLMRPLAEDTIRHARAAYLGLCELFDSFVGRLLAKLDETGLARNTLVIYVSDHGELAGEHGCWTKSNYYEGSAGVPLIARLPGVIEAGSSSSAVCSLTDVGPTLVELSGAEEMIDVDGRSLWPTMRGRHPADWPNETFSELVDLRTWPRTREAMQSNYPSRMIRSGKWKLWTFGDEENLPPVMFDLEADPGETKDLGRDPAHAETREGLLARARDGWDPVYASRRTVELRRWSYVLNSWGRAVAPEHEDALAAPGPELEGDVVLL